MKKDRKRGRNETKKRQWKDKGRQTKAGREIKGEVEVEVSLGRNI